MTKKTAKQVALQMEQMYPNLFQVFDRLNKEKFGGKLPVPQLEWMWGVKTGGMFHWKPMKIRISKQYFQAYGMEQVEAIMLHEMVHLWEFVNFGKTGHGKRFKDKLEEVAGTRNIHCPPLPLRFFKYEYQCPVCGKRFGATERWRETRYCTCRGGYTPETVLKLVREDYE